MQSRISSLLNIKPAEAGIVKQLFLVQFFLGVATSFLFTSALTLFIATYDIRQLPNVSVLTAGLLLVANFGYARLEEKYSAKKLLSLIILFSMVSLALTWLEATIYPVSWLPFFLSAWNMVVYMLVGYAFWGMAAIIFNVRESKRIFTVVGSGDIPAKILGYAAVAVLVPVIGVHNMLLISVGAFIVAYYFLHRFNHPAIIQSHDHSHNANQHPTAQHSSHKSHSLFSSIFHNRLIFIIAVWSLIGFIIFSLIDFTFVTEIKSRYKTSHELAAFLGLFFALGRVAAIIFKLLFSSRVISRLGLANSLLIMPIILALICGFILFSAGDFKATLLVFGIMVLLSEVLKSAVQDPAFFILFQPLDPHARLKGHLITKGYTMPFALLAVSGFVYVFRNNLGEISIEFVCKSLLLLLVGWAITVFLIKKEYLSTLIHSLKKGYFTGTQLFLNEQPVRDLLLAKTQSPKPQEVIIALELLERSGYKKLPNLLLQNLANPFNQVKIYVLGRIIKHRIKEAFPLVQKHLTQNPDAELKSELIKVFYCLKERVSTTDQAWQHLDLEGKKVALLGLATRPEPEVGQIFRQEVKYLALSAVEKENLVALDVMAVVPEAAGAEELANLLNSKAPLVVKKALEVTGTAKKFNLLPEMIAATARHHYVTSFQQGILNFGDEVFAPEYLPSQNLPASFTTALHKTAGKVKGPHSTAYLLGVFATEKNLQDQIIQALFLKKAEINLTGQANIKAFIQAKLEQDKIKMQLYWATAPFNQLQLLSEALYRELEQDLQTILKSFALLHHRAHLERVLELLNGNQPDRMFNAIEMLELSVPKRYFTAVDAILEFLQDIRSGKASLPTSFKQEPSQVLRNILTDKQAGLNAWTQSVACYLIPELKNPVALKEMLTQETNGAGELFSQTKTYVLSQIS